MIYTCLGACADAISLLDLVTLRACAGAIVGLGFWPFPCVMNPGGRVKQ